MCIFVQLAGLTDGCCFFLHRGEVYPVRVRQTGFGLCKGIGNGFGGLAPFAANLLNPIWHPLPALLILLFCTVGLLAGVMLPTHLEGEMIKRDKSLSETPDI